MPTQIAINNFRGLRHVAWSPGGLCALTGANGAGKTTLLLSLELLRQVYARNFLDAFSLPVFGGLWGLKHFAAPAEEPISFALSQREVRWEIELLLDGGTPNNLAPERIFENDSLIAERKAYRNIVAYCDEMIGAGDSTALRAIYVGGATYLSVLVNWLLGFRSYLDYHLWKVREYGSRISADLYLNPTGENVFSVLRNWRDKRDSLPKYEFVREALKHALPDFFDDFDFEVAGANVALRIYRHGIREPMPHHLAPEGFLYLLLNATAVAGAQNGSIVAIDQVEDALHPYAIRSLLDDFQEQADRCDLTVVVTTHSPVVLDHFADHPEQVFIMDEEAETNPVRLTDHRDPEWLANFSLGRLYANLDYGAPKRIRPNGSGKKVN